MYMKVTAKSAALQRAVDFHVILPYHDGYPGPDRPWPVLVFLPGYSGSAEEIVFALPLRQMVTKYGIAVLVPDGENAFYTDHPERANRMGAYAGEELLRMARRLVPGLSPRREETFLGGISMGGYGAAVLGLHYPDLYSRLVLFSPAADPERLLSPEMKDTEGAVPPQLFESLLGSRTAYRKNPRLNPEAAALEYARTGRPLPPFWICCGSEDALVGDVARSFRDTLLRCGAEVCWEDGPGSHDLMYWDDHLENAFRFLRSGLTDRETL